MEDLYRILGVNAQASQDDIKKAYRKLASRHHPDHGGDTQKFQQIHAAYQILSDPRQRQQYDNPAPFPKFFSDVFDFGQFDFFRQTMRPQVLRINLLLDIKDVYQISKKIVSVNVNGQYHTVEIDIPAGLEDGQAVRYQRLGSTGEDIVIVFKIRPDPVFEKHKQNLCLQHNCSFWTLICGGQITVRDPLGNAISVTVPPQTKPNTKLRIANRGFPVIDGDRGDFLITVTAVLPDHISEDLLMHIKKEMAQH